MSSEDTKKGWVAALREFDWLKIPGAARAIASLVGSLGEAGSAWIDVGAAKGQQLAQSIRNETAARQALIQALAKRAAEVGPDDQALVQRSIDRWVRDELKKQENREAVAIKTAELLSEDAAVAPPATEGPDDDWLNFFGSHAERASSEKLRETWARILAGEIKRPGAFSFRTLHFMSVLDQKLASDIEAVSALISTNRLTAELGAIGPQPKSMRKGPGLARLQRLEAAGYVHTGLSINLLLEPNKPFFVLYPSRAIRVSAVTPTKIDTSIIALTEVGSEIHSILPPRTDAAAVVEIAHEFGKQSGVTAHVGERIPEENQYKNFVEVPKA